MTLPVAVVIPTFNRAHTLPRAIDSVLQQTNAPNEIWIVDDGSVDGTADYVTTQYPELSFVYQDNAGVSAARNTGIKQSNSPWIAFLDSDDEWLPGKLEQQFAAIAENPDSRIFHTDEIWIRNGKRVNPMQKHKKQGGDIFTQSLALCAMSPSTVILHRSLLQDEGLFDETLPACEDYDLWLRLCSLHEVAFLDKPLVRKYGGHADQLSKKHWGMDRFRVISLSKLLRRGRLTESQELAARSMLQEKCRVLLIGAEKRENLDIIELCSQLLAEFELR